VKNFEIFLSSDNEELYSNFQQFLKSFFKDGDFEILKNDIFIFTRENYTAEHLRLNLVKDGLPSLAFQTFSTRNGILQFAPDFWESGEILSDLAGTLLFKHILDQKEKSKLSGKVTLKIAEALFREREKSIQSLETISTTHPYRYAFEEFEKLRKNRKTYSENLKYFFLERSFKVPETVIQRIFGKTIFFYALTEIDLLTFKILEKISEFFKLNFFMDRPPFFSGSFGNEKNDFPYRELLPSSNIFQYISKGYSLNPVQEKKEFPKIRFARALEIRREIEYAGRSILKKVADHKADKGFKLIQVKIIIPKSEMYAQMVKEVFGELRIPASFTFDGSVKLTPYYSIVIAILRFAESDFESEIFRDIIHNPCFKPPFLVGPKKHQPDLWSEFISNATIVKFLDSSHRAKMGISPEDFLSWDRGWRILSRKISGMDAEDAVIDDEFEKEEAMNFIRISSSFLYDLQYLKENKSSLKTKADFFKIFLQTYISASSVNLFGEEELSFHNKTVESLIYGILNEISECGETAEALDDIDFTTFSDILKKRMSGIRAGSSGVLKRGVVVGTIQDTTDEVFRYIYVLGTDESNFSSSPINGNFFGEEPRSYELQKDLNALNKMYFYKIFQHKPEEIVFSYVCIDSIRDSPIYPYSELEDFKAEYFPDSVWEDIPLFGTQEILQRRNPGLLWEKNIVDLAELKLSESSTEYLRFANPDFVTDTGDLLKEEIHRLPVDSFLKSKIENHFLRKKTEPIEKFHSKKLFYPVSDFIKYIECPQKYFFEKSLDLDEEVFYPEENFETNKFLKSKILKNMVLNFISDPSLDFGRIFSDYFQGLHLERGNIPIGIPGEIEFHAWKDYFYRFVRPLRETILKQYRAVQEIQIGERFLKLSDQGYTVSSPVFQGEETRQGPDILLFTDSLTLSVTIETSPRRKKDKPFNKQMMRSALLAISILNSPKTLDDIQLITGNNDVRPAILRIPVDAIPFLVVGNVSSTDEKIFESFSREFRSGKFPASPIDTKLHPCDYCGMKEVCLRKKTGFEEFLEHEKVSIKNYLEGCFK